MSSRTRPRIPFLPVVNGAELAARLEREPPAEPRPVEELLDEVREVLVPASRKNGHPRSFGYVCASADPVAALFDALASVLYQNVIAWRSAPAMAELERLVVRWIGQLVGFGERAHGLLTQQFCAVVWIEPSGNTKPALERTSPSKSCQWAAREPRALGRPTSPLTSRNVPSPTLRRSASTPPERLT
ncbi:MAG: hypothetical protein GY711_23565 [bacterium]|nr:hypothetical protein [bacterium]